MNTKGEFSNADYRYIGEKLPPVRRRRCAGRDQSRDAGDKKNYMEGV